MATLPSDREPMDVLAEEFADRWRRGERPLVTDYAERYPQWADEIQQLLPGVALLEQLRQARLRASPTSEPKLDRLGDFRILRELGRGGMGVVYEAVQESLGRHVALKVLPQHALLDPKAVERFHREAQAAARLHHSHIVPVFGVGECDGLHYFVMQLIDGRGLDDVLRELRRGPAPTADSGAVPAWPDQGRPYWHWVARIGKQAAEALHHAHLQGTIHRDVKPANLLLDARGHIWVTDFGVAKLAADRALTGAGEVLGTLHYMAPENLQGRADARGDVYGLGLTLYELLTLEPAFDAADPSTLVRQVSEHEPVRPRRRNPAIPRDLETVVLKAIAREREHRYQSAGELADDLQRYLEDRPVRARRSSLAARGVRWCRRNQLAAGLAATALLALLLAAASGWVGYVRTTRALDREAVRALEAEAATARAEANVELSLRAFEQIFNQVAPRELPLPIREAFAAELAGRDLRPPIAEENPALLRSVLRFYDEFAERNATNAGLRREAAKAHRRVGDLYRHFGQHAEAATAHGRAAALYEKLSEEFPGAVEYRTELADVLGVLPPPEAPAAALAEAEGRLRRALAVSTDLAAEPGGRGDHLALLARTHGRLAVVHDRQGRLDDAEAEYRRAVVVQREARERFGDVPANALQLATARYALAGFLRKRERLNDARAVLEESITDLKPFLDTDAPFRPGLWLLARNYRDLAAIHQLLGETATAGEFTRQADELTRHVPALPAGRPFDSPKGPRGSPPR